MAEPAPLRAALRLRLFLLADRSLRRLAGGLQALHQGFWLGVMDRESIHALNRRYYRQLDRYHEPDYNRLGLWEWERRALEAHFADCRTVLVAGAGGGREVLGLCRRGLQVEAFDCSAELVRSCKALLASEALGARILEAEPDEVPEGASACDGALIGWAAYMHIPGRERRIRFLRRIGERLQAGGPLLLSYFVRIPSAGSYPVVRAFGNILRAARGAERLELGDTLAGTFDHHFTENEIASELREAGFEPIQFAAEPYGHAVARKSRRTGP